MHDSLLPIKDPGVDRHNWKPRSVVWELTLACNLRCDHCGSRAGKKMADELSTDECLDLVRQLKDLGCELITLSGGEPTLRGDWDVIARAVADRKMFVNMVTNGVYGGGVSATEIAERALRAGMCNVGVSIDGPLEIHDRIRGNGTFEKTTASIRAFKQKGLSTTVMATVNKLNVDRLWDIRKAAVAVGARALRFQLAKPMGTMDDHRDWVIEPERIKTLLPELARMKQAGGIDIRVGDSLGYYGKPDKALREWSWKNKKTKWGGCQAGMQAIGIQANGDIKGCLSLQAARGSSDPFVEGNVRDHSLSEIWYRPGAFNYNREFSLGALTHDCRECTQANRCRGGARCISSAVDNTVTHDDYCYYRFAADDESLPWVAAGKSAAAAAALVLTVNTAACVSEKKPTRPDAGDTSSDISTDSELSTETDLSTDSEVTTDDTETFVDTGSDTAVLEYGIEPDYGVMPDTASDTAVLEYGIEPDYGVTPDTASDTAVLEYGIEPDYGVTPDTASDTAVLEYGIEPDYGITPDTGFDTETEPMMEYGITPDYGVEPTDTDTSTPDTGFDTETEPMMEYGITPDYGVEPVDTETAASDSETGTQLDYGLLPD